MKINFYPQVTALFNRVSGKSEDKREGAGQNAFERNPKNQKENEKPEEFQALVSEEVKDGDVKEAIEAFGSDPLNRGQGISASVQGQGPGLKVVLKDASGGVLRAVSGEEFLKLRQSLKQGRRSGHIVDEKA